MTSKNTRHCVNSVSLTFQPSPKTQEYQSAVFASGCFWGTEYFLGRLPGVVSTQVGYIGGHLEKPTYEEVCSKTTGHYEAVEVVFDSSKTDFTSLLKLFFETHDFSQIDGQGPDIGPQYRSAIFYRSENQKSQAEAIMTELKAKGLSVATKLIEATKFWPAEDYHQNYYEAKGESPYCHRYRKIF